MGGKILGGFVKTRKEKVSDYPRAFRYKIGVKTERENEVAIKNKRIFVTGGGGFIGSSLAEWLVDDNEIVLYDINFKNNSIGYSDIINHPNVIFIQGDVLDFEKVSREIKKPNIVVHTAAVVGVENVIKQPRETLDINFVGTSNLLKAVYDEPSLERFIYFSTSEVFGSNAFRVDENKNSSLGSANEARWSYSISKIAGEHLVQSYHREYGMPTVIVRPFNIFGTRRIGEHVMKIFICQALKNEDITIFQDGSQIRSWCYISDFCDALIKCMEKDLAIGHSFNIGNSLNTLTIYELAKLIIRLCNSNSKIRFRDITYSDIDIRVPNILKARELLGYEPKVEIEEGIIRAKEWYEKFLNRETKT